MYQDISIKEALALNNVCLIDVRSEAEYQEATIPGSINIPILNNDQRSQVGTMYRKVGPDQAKELGWQLVGPKSAEIYEQYRKLARNQELVLFCWRGGLRSIYTAQFLSERGLPVKRIIGGYKAYRRYINQYLERESIPHRVIVLHGLTGVGKTDILARLAELNLPVLDLEGLARHRGSVFGKVGLPSSPSQKDFEALIVAKLRQAERKGVILVECESKRVGRLMVPMAIMNGMKKGYNILIYASLSNRVRRLNEIYTVGPGHNITELKECVSSLYKFLGHQKVEELNQLLDHQDFTAVTTDLLVNYYDPLYKYPAAPSDQYDLSVSGDNLDQAVDQISHWVTHLPEYNVPVIIGGENSEHWGISPAGQTDEGLDFRASRGRN